MYGTNVVVVNNQSHNSKKILLFADWLFSTTTLDLYIFFWDVLITPGGWMVVKLHIGNFLVHGGGV